MIGPLNRNDRVALGQGKAGVVAVHIRKLANLRAGLAHRPPVVERLQFIELVEMRVDRVGQLIDQPRACAHGHFCPFGRDESPARAGDRSIDVSYIGVNGMSDHLAVARRDHRNRRPRSCRRFDAVDEQATDH